MIEQKKGNKKMSKTYDIETIVTAEIDELHPNVELGDNFDLEKYKAIVRRDLLRTFPEEFRLKTNVKVQVFLHEKAENAPKSE